MEILIVDDCSTDATPEIIHELQAEDRRISYFRLPQNSNRPAVPRNFGLKQAQGRYVAFLDHDDLWFPRKLERQMAVLEREPGIAMVHASLLFFPDKRRARSFLKLPNPLEHTASTANLRSGNPVLCSSVMARASVIREFGGFDERPELRAVEDYHLWLRMSESYEIRYMSEILGYYRTNAASTSGTEDMGRRLDVLEAEGLIARTPRDPWRVRAIRRSWGLPIALYDHLPDARLRQKRGLPPRTF